MNTIYALGFFDGVHLGHQALLTACRHLAERHGCSAGVVTFATHPDALVTGQTPPLINTVDERQRLILAYGSFHIAVLPFDEKLMKMPWQSFLEDLLQKGAAGFVCGEDFRFGHKGEGTAHALAAFCKERGMPWAVVSSQELNGIRISSTHIRQLLRAGDVESANRFLGHSHMLSGKVIPGRGIGRTMGVPTANLQISEEICLPRQGVYACSALVDGQTHVAVTNIGSRPTVGGSHVTVEPWLLDFEGDLYGKILTLHFHKYLRPELKFETLEALKAQIRQDAAQAFRLLR